MVFNHFIRNARAQLRSFL